MSKAKKTLKKALLVVTGSFIGLALSIGLIAGPILANSDSEAEQALIKALANGLYEHPDSALLDKAADLLIAMNKGEGESIEVLGLLRNQRNESPFERVCFKDSDTFICRAVFWEEMSLPAASANTTTISERNFLTQPYWIDYLMVELEGTVSGSNQGLVVAVGTSTNGFGPTFDASSTLIQSGLLARSNFPTSSQQVQFVPTYKNYFVATSSYGVGNVAGDLNPAWRVPTTSYVTAFVQVGGNTSTAGVCHPGVVGVSCEQVTSSNRGWTGRVIWRGNYRVSL